MLKILFSPSEGKNSGGVEKNSTIFGAIESREEILYEYNKIVNSKNEEEILKLFGLKSMKEAKPYKQDIFTSPKMEAIRRYQGVAYDYLDFNSLTKEAKEYLFKNTIIFSNLYGPVFGGDFIANYKVKQGNSIGNIKPEVFYKKHFSDILDEELKSCEIIDLRAGYYDKFYKIKKEYLTIKFLKNGKVVSHWAKAYRGIVLRELTRGNVESIEEFMSLDIKNLNFKL